LLLTPIKQLMRSLFINTLALHLHVFGFNVMCRTTTSDIGQCVACTLVDVCCD